MIGCFPVPYSNELFYSICARFSNRVRYSKKNAVIRDLFTKNRVSAIVDLPTCFDTLIRNLPPGHRYTADELIDKYTLLPFYGPFILPERHHRLRADMRGENGQGLHMRIGITAHTVPLPEFLRFCPHCAEEDKKTTGEYYWHRIHQVPGVLVCPIHQIFIQDSNIRVRNVAEQRIFIPAEQAIEITPPNRLDTSDRGHTALLRIADDVAWLLSQSNLVIPGEIRHQRYIRALKDRGLMTHSGFVRQLELLQSFKNYYTPDFLSLLHCQLSERMEENWLARLINLSDGISSTQHPLHHLLLMQFLGYCAATFFAPSSSEKDELCASSRHPFGEGPWPCLNIACDYYRKPLIKTCQVSYSHRRERRPHGMVSCVCGFTYSRVGPDKSPEDRFLVTKVKTFGSIWEQQLRELWADNHLSLDQMALELGVTRLTVKDHAVRLGLGPRLSKLRSREARWIQMPALIQKECKEERELDQRTSYRATWLSIINGGVEVNNEVSPKEIQTICKWLSRNDAAWLNTHPRIIVNARQPRVEWQSRDECLAGEVRRAAESLKNLSGCPVLISRSAIRRVLGSNASLIKHLDRLPLTFDILAEVVESYEQWGIRRIEWAAELYRQERLHPTKGQLVRRAHVEYYYYADVASVKEALDVALHTFNSIDNV